jgi:hypothetical protein
MKSKIPYWQSTKCPLHKRGVEPKYSHISEEHKNEIINLFKTGEYTFNKLAIKYNRHISSIKKLLNKNGLTAIETTISCRKYSINENYFDEIDCEDKAYYLGFLFADGYNNTKKNEISITLNIRDKSILELFLDCIESNRPIRIKGNYCSVSIGNKHLSQQLSILGCGKAKTHTLQFPIGLNEKYYAPFVRGYFDGDGSFSFNKRIKSNMTFTITSAKRFLIEVQRVLNREIGLRFTKITDIKHAKSSIGVLLYGGRNNCVLFRDWIYKNATVFLTRKYIKFHMI